MLGGGVSRYPCLSHNPNPASPRNPGSIPAICSIKIKYIYQLIRFQPLKLELEKSIFMHKVILLYVYLHLKKRLEMITCMCALCPKQTSYAWWKPNDIGRSYVQSRKMHPRARMEGPPRPFLPRAAKQLTPALHAGPNARNPPPPPPPPPPACIYTRQGCRGPQDLPCARPI